MIKYSVFLILLSVVSAVNAGTVSTPVMPDAKDYTYMWWAYGWRGFSYKPRVVCFRTGYYGLALDTQLVTISSLGRFQSSESMHNALVEDNNAVFNLPDSELILTVTVGSKTYRCSGAGDYTKNSIASNTFRIIDSGRYVQRADIEQLIFKDDSGHRLNAQGRLEIVVWPDRLSLILEISPNEKFENMRVSVTLNQSDMKVLSETTSANDIALPGEKYESCLLLDASANKCDSSSLQCSITDIYDGKKLDVSYDNQRSWHHVRLPFVDWNDPNGWDKETGPNKTFRYLLEVVNSADSDATARMLFDSNSFITGGVCVIRDKEGMPTGIPVQISKNWQKSPEHRILYEGIWFHGFTMLHVPARTKLQYELMLVCGTWGGVPAVSHSQLCLIGWGVNQLWDQVAVGNCGESICYDPDMHLGRSMIDDVRPLMVWTMGQNKVKWGWTNNVGGGDFLVYINNNGNRQYLSRVKTCYKRYGPNLTEVNYSGITSDGAVSATITVSTTRSDEMNRSFHHVRYDVLAPAQFSRLAFYQLGSDGYNDHQFNKMAWGNADGMVEEWMPQWGQRKYHRQPFECKGIAPWFSLHEGIDCKDRRGGAWANRGLIIRSWKARLSGRDIPFPFASSYGTEDTVPSANLEISPPPGMFALWPGDYVDAEFELITPPQFADDYYGPNEGLKQALKEYGNTYKIVLREASENDLRINITEGRLINKYPVEIEVSKNQAARFSVSKGIGYIPFRFNNLEGYRGYVLSEVIEGKKISVDQSVLGNDFWQTDYDASSKTWQITYNVNMEKGGRPKSREFVFERTETNSRKKE